MLGVQAVAETAAFLGTGLVIYLSFNAVMHPWTLQIQLTHLLPWPSEGTVRVIALAICLVAVAGEPLPAGHRGPGQRRRPGRARRGRPVPSRPARRDPAQPGRGEPLAAAPLVVRRRVGPWQLP